MRGRRGEDFASDSQKSGSDRVAVPYPGPGKLFIIWTVVGILTSLRFQFQRPPNADAAQLALKFAFIVTYYPWIALAPVVFRLEQRFPLGGAGWVRNLGIFLAVSVPVSLLVSPLTMWLWSSWTRASFCGCIGATW